jgi:hypothetical protein
MLTALLLFLAPCATAQDPAPPLFEVSLTPGSELWNEVRYRASLDPKTSLDPDQGDPVLKEAVASARRIAPMLASDRVWSTFDDPANRVEAGQWLSAMAKIKLPGRLLAEGAKRKPLRLELEVLFASLDSAAGPWMERQWPARQAALLETAAELEKLFGPEAQASALLRLDRWVGLPPPTKPVPIHLVTRAPAPGGMTLGSENLALSVVSVKDRSPLLVTEVILHEVMHALERRPIAPPPLFARVTGTLLQARVRNPDIRWEYIHTFYYLAAAEVVRGTIDLNHIDHGLTEGHYASVPKAYETLAPLWSSYVARDLSQDAMLEAVAAAAKER